MTMDTTGTDVMGGGMAGTTREPKPASNVGGMTPGTREPFVDRAATAAHQAVDRVAAKAGPAVERVRAAAQGSAETLQTKLSDLDTMREEWTESARTYVRERPLTSLGVAVLAGYLLSRWMREP